MPKKLKGGPFGIFQHPFCRKTAKKIEGDLLVGKNLKKSRTVPKKIVSSGMVCYAETFWFSSLGLQVQFGVFSKFCRTFGRTILVTSGGLKKH